MGHQTRFMSAIEQICNVGSGFICAMLVWRFFVVPFLGIEPGLGSNFKVTCVFTAVSIVRGYIWRRLFNRGFTRKGTVNEG